MVARRGIDWCDTHEHEEWRRLANGTVAAQGGDEEHQGADNDEDNRWG